MTAALPQTQTPPPEAKYHRARIEPGVSCGCYFCLTVFDGGTVTEWADAGETALCPRCSIDAVLPDETRIEALAALHERWFCQGTDDIPEIPRKIPRKAPRVFIDMDGVIVDFARYAEQVGLPGVELKKVPGAYRAMAPIPGAIEAVRALIARGYEVWIATKPPTGVAGAYSEKAEWIFEYLPELSHRIVITHDKGFLGDANDFLIDDRPHKANCESFAGTLLPFVDGMTWALVLERLVAPKVFFGGDADFLTDDRPCPANCENFAGARLPIVDARAWDVALAWLAASANSPHLECSPKPTDGGPPQQGITSRPDKNLL